jgi:methylmalonyl-CoA decarboxylase subunit alpha
MATRSVQERIKNLEDREARILDMGGPEAVERQKTAGKLTARERLRAFLDPGTFRELDLYVTHRCTHYDMGSTEIAADGVITGFGKVGGRTVYVYAQDFTSRAGTLGEMHARKICKVMDAAMRSGAPVIGFCDSGGARIQEGVDALAGYGEIFYRNALASGTIPQITAVMGPTAGGAVYSPAMTDWVFMVDKTSYMFITGPDVIRAVTGEQVTQEELGGARAHNEKSGVAHFSCPSDLDAIEGIRELLSYLPSNNLEDPPRVFSGDLSGRESPELDRLVPDNPAETYDVKDLIRSLADEGVFLEPHRHYAPNIVVAFARMGGCPVGFIANQPRVMAGCLDVHASDKATRFIRFCDAFNIPLITIADVPGYLPGKDQEWSGIIRHGAKLLWCYSEATVPKVTVIVRKAYGGAYLAMCSRHLGADMVIAWPTAEIAVMGAEGAANIIHRKTIREANDPESVRREKIEEYRGLFYNPYIASSRGYIDQVIPPRETRPRILEALEALAGKREPRPPKKHGNIPV